jgi:hypothetical protein
LIEGLSSTLKTWQRDKLLKFEFGCQRAVE